MTKIGEEIRSVLDDFVAENCLPLLEDSDVTVGRVAEKSGIGEGAVRNILNKQVKSGEYKIIYKRTGKGLRIATYVKV